MTNTSKNPSSLRPRQRRTRQAEHSRCEIIRSKLMTLFADRSVHDASLKSISRMLAMMPLPANDCVSDENARRHIYLTLRGHSPRRRTTAQLARWLTDEYLRCISEGSVASVAEFVSRILPTLTTPNSFLEPSTIYSHFKIYRNNSL